MSTANPAVVQPRSAHQDAPHLVALVRAARFEDSQLTQHPQARAMSIIALRPATATDSEFCFQLHKAAMGEYVQAIWGWDEQVQRDYHNRGFAPGQWQIITVEGTDVGMLSVEYRQTETYLASKSSPATKAKE